MATAVSVRGVSKRFRLYQEKYQSLKERVIRFGRVPYEEFWALRDVELDIEEGSTVGLLGHNGSGKSTLLKCVAGILQPTTGEIATRGRLAALLELGAGFQPELTGRENVYLNGSILGLSRRELDRRLDEIVDFAELGQFIDTQVRFYSSGMYVRLGFAVAVNVDPDVLLVDEVLAVGDEAFQRKCLDRVARFQRDGRTIVVVTHAADLVRQVCDVAAVLDHGELVAVGSPGEAVRSFREHLLQHEPYEVHGELESMDSSSQEARQGAECGRVPSHHEQLRTFGIRITSVELEHPGRPERAYLLPGERLVVRVGYEAPEPIDDVAFGINVYDSQGRLLYGSNTLLQDVPVGVLHGHGEVRFEFEKVPFLDGDYPITLGVASRDGAVVYDWREQWYRFAVMNPGQTFGSIDLPMRITLSSSPSAQRIAR